MKNLYIVVGASGVGKDTLVNRLVNDYGLRRVITYTDRPIREGESPDSHRFLSLEEFEELRPKLIEGVVYNGYHYGTTAECYDSADIVVLEPVGVKAVKRLYTHRPIKVIGLWKERSVLVQRMILRGDSRQAIRERIRTDMRVFENLQEICDFYVENDDLELLVEDVKGFIESCESVYHV